MNGIEVGNKNFTNIQTGFDDDILDLEVTILDDMEVEMDDPQSKLEDSAEEIAFTKDNSKQTKLANRKQKDNQERVEQRMERFKKLFSSKISKTSNDKNALMNLSKKWKDNLAEVEEILESLNKLGTHSSSAYVFLDELANDDEFASIKDTLIEAKNTLFEKEHSSIIAAINAIEIAEQSPEIGDSVVLCQAYSDITNNFAEANDMLEYILAKYDTNTEGCIDFMTKALAADLAMIESSQDRVSLELVGSNLTKVRQLNGARTIIESSLENMQKLSNSNIDVNSLKVLNNILKLSNSRFVVASQVRNVYDFIKKQNPEVEVLLAQEMLRDIREFSPDVFNSSKERLTLLEGTQKLVDECIEKEDAWLASGGA